MESQFIFKERNIGLTFVYDYSGSSGDMPVAVDRVQGEAKRLGVRIYTFSVPHRALSIFQISLNDLDMIFIACYAGIQEGWRLKSIKKGEARALDSKENAILIGRDKNVKKTEAIIKMASRPIQVSRA